MDRLDESKNDIKTLNSAMIGINKLANKAIKLLKDAKHDEALTELLRTTFSISIIMRRAPYLAHITHIGVVCLCKCMCLCGKIFVYVVFKCVCCGAVYNVLG